MAIYSDLQKLSIFGYSVGKTALYFSQLRTLSWLTRMAGPNEGLPEEKSDAILYQIRNEVRQALTDDVDLIQRLGLTGNFLTVPRPLDFSLRTLDVFSDAARVHWRRLKGKTQDFVSKEALKLKEDAELPRYFLRNFHFQTDGYLSKASARRYEHQVELLFGGLGDTMRRLAIEEMDRAFPAKKYAKRPLRILEIGAGVGTSGYWVKKAYPGSTLTLTDLSEPYLQEARLKFMGVPRVDFVRAAAESIPFKDETFDVVFSVFLFHELPESVRRAAFVEMKRILKPGGKFIAVDSLQSADEKNLEPVLQAFPRDYHEPYFRNYLSIPLEKIAKDAGFATIGKIHRRFLSRSFTATK